MAMVPSTMQEYLATKYAILQQQANAQSTQAAATTQNAATAAITGKAQAGLDTVRTQLLPGESAAGIAKTNAETGLIGQTAKYYGPEAMARIALTSAQTRGTNVDTDASILTRLTDINSPGASGRISNIFDRYTGYRLGQ